MAVPVEAMAPVSLVQAADVVRSGGVIAYPTEAVYGLGCDPRCEAAVQRILELKGRPADKGLIVLANHIDDVHGWIDWDDVLLQRVQPTWPGPVTWIVPATDQAPPWLLVDGQLALRVTDHADARQLITACGCALVSTSANRAGEPAPSTSTSS